MQTNWMKSSLAVKMENNKEEAGEVVGEAVISVVNPFTTPLKNPYSRKVAFNLRENIKTTPTMNQSIRSTDPLVTYQLEEKEVVRTEEVKFKIKLIVDNTSSTVTRPIQKIINLDKITSTADLKHMNNDTPIKIKTSQSSIITNPTLLRECKIKIGVLKIVSTIMNLIKVRCKEEAKM